MLKSRRNDPPKEDYQQLDNVTINEKITQVSEDIESFIEAQDKRFDQLEEGLDTRFAEMTKKLTDAISGKQQETRREGHDQKRRKKSEEKAAEPEQEDVDEESDMEEGDSKVEVGPADSEEETKGKEKDEGKKVNATKEEAAAKPIKEEKKEAKASTSNANKEKKKPAAKKKGKEKVNEEVKGPTKGELQAAISKLLEEASLDPITPANIRRQLGAQFKVDLRDRKEEVTQIIDDVINSMLCS